MCQCGKNDQSITIIATVIVIFASVISNIFI